MRYMFHGIGPSRCFLDVHGRLSSRNPPAIRRYSGRRVRQLSSSLATAAQSGRAGSARHPLARTRLGQIRVANWPNHPALDRSRVARPLNLVLVIDRSGSMAGDRIANVKKSIFAFVEKLRKQDSVAIVSYSATARVDLSACRKTSHAKITKAIESLSADQSTNLHAGLMLGYEEALKNFDSDKSNRVILLTDGIANEGVVDPVQIAQESSRFNKEGIELSVIGLGENFNRDLLRQLADAGRGLLHFVNDGQDIQKTFVDEIDSLLSPAARNVKLTVDFRDLKKLPKVFGYEPKIDGSKMSFRLDNLNCGATQVVLLEFKNKAETSPVKVELNYVDQIDHLPVSVCRIAKLETRKRSSDSEQSDDLEKNYVIARVADSLEQSAKFCERNDYEKAAKKLNQGIRYAQAEFHQDCDQDVDRIVEIASKQQEQLTAAIESQRRMETAHHHRRK